MSYMKKTIISGALTFTLAASLLAGCGKHINGTAAAISVNGEEINVGTANFMLRYQQAEVASMMQAYGFTTGSTLWDTDLSGDDEEAEAESASSASSASEESASSASSSAGEETEEKSYATYGEQFKDTVLDDLEKAVLMRQHTSDYGFSLTEDQQAKIDEVASKLCEENSDLLGKLGSTEADVNQVVELMSYEYLMHDTMTEDVDREVSDEEAKQSTITYARFSTNITDEDSGETREMTDEEKAEVQKKAEQLLEKIKAEDNVAEADISALATEIDENATSLSPSYGDDDTTYPDEVKEAAATLKDGELYDGVIDTSGYLYIVRLDKDFDEEMTESKKASIVSQREQDRIDELTETWLDEAEIEVKDGWTSLEVTDTDPFEVKTAD